MDFDTAFNRLVDPQHEGGYVNNPNDPGGETKYGISKRAFPGEDIPNLTLDRAKQIYCDKYWGPAGCDGVPSEVAYELFDMAVNMGVGTAIKALQQAVGADPDGVLGPKTLMCAQAMNGAAALRKLQAIRLQRYTAMPKDWRDNFLAGVVNRVATNMLEA